MKKALVFFLIVLFLPAIAFSAVDARIHFSEEISYSSYNRIWVSPEENYFSVESVINNPNITNELDLMFSKCFGVEFGIGFGYQSSIFDYNRFITIPKSVNGTVNGGFVLKLNNVRIALSAVLRSSFQMARNNWVSQIGGMADLSYCLNNGLTFIASYKYLYNYNMISSGVSFGVGYSVGGKK